MLNVCRLVLGISVTTRGRVMPARERERGTYVRTYCISPCHTNVRYHRNFKAGPDPASSTPSNAASREAFARVDADAPRLRNAHAQPRPKPSPCQCLQSYRTQSCPVHWGPEAFPPVHSGAPDPIHG